MAEAVHDAERLAELQALPLDRKIQISQARIIEWYNHYHGNVVVSFSGGKDSTVLLHMVRRIYPHVKAVFSNTGLEYPEIQRFVKAQDNVDIVTPTMRFNEVISTYGYPLISKEIAEAIYYARRICSQTVNVERERRGVEILRKRRELLGQRYCESAANCWETGRMEEAGIGGGENNLIQTGTARNRRTVLMGRMPSADGRNSGGGTLGAAETARRRNDLEGKHQRTPRVRRAGIANGKTGEVAVFSNGKQYGEKSIFNKEKYLPLARDVPVLISHYCCQKMKKQPMKRYQHKNKLYPLLGTLAEESRIRKQAWIRHGCNAFESKSPTSQPLSFWTEQDILAYIVYYGLEIAPVYGDIITADEDGNQYNAREMIAPCGKLSCSGCDRTGCVFCGFGFHNERGVTRFQRLALTHPKQYEYCIGGENGYLIRIMIPQPRNGMASGRTGIRSKSGAAQARDSAWAKCSTW